MSITFEEASRKPGTGKWEPHDLSDPYSFPVQVVYRDANGQDPEEVEWDIRPRVVLNDPAHVADKFEKMKLVAFNRRKIARAVLNLPQVIRSLAIFLPS